MRYYLLKLKFTTPVHFGTAQSGGGLEKINPSCTAATFFSALCNEAAAQGQLTLLADLVDKVEQGDLLFSDLFLYLDTVDDSCLYLPRPVLQTAQNSNIRDLQRVRKDAAAEKAKRRINYIRAGKLEAYWKNLQKGLVDPEDLPMFGTVDLIQNVNCRPEEPLPYSVGVYRFADGAGLYFIVGMQGERDMEALLPLIESLGYSGIGGRRSTGYGKFEPAEDPILIDRNDWVYEDDAALYRLLHPTRSSRWMNISATLPQREEIAVVSGGAYKLCMDSGFVFAPEIREVRKRDSLYMLAAGSCLPEKIEGRVAALVYDDYQHPIYRYGKGLFVGLPL